MPDAPVTWDETEEVGPSWDETQPVQAGPDLSKVRISPYDLAAIAAFKAGRGKPESGMESGSELTTAVAQNPLGALGTLASVPFRAAVGAAGAVVNPLLRRKTPEFGESQEEFESRRDPIQYGKSFVPHKETALEPEGTDAGRLLERWTTPEGVLMIPAGMTAIGAVALMTQMAPGLVQQISDTAKGGGSEIEKRDRINDLFALGLMVSGGGSAKGIREGLKAPPEEAPFPTGAALQTPEGSAVPPRVPFNLPDAVSVDQGGVIAKALDSMWEAGAHGNEMPTRAGLEKKAGRTFTDREWEVIQKNHAQGQEFGLNELGVMTPDQAANHAIKEYGDWLNKSEHGGDALAGIAEKQKRGETLTKPEQDLVDHMAAWVKKRAIDIHNHQRQKAGLEPISEASAAPEPPVAPSKVSPHDFVPGIQDVAGNDIPGTKGQVHNDILETKKADMDWRMDNFEHTMPEGKGRGFYYKGKFVSREEASRLLGEKEPLQSERLIELQKAAPETEGEGAALIRLTAEKAKGPLSAEDQAKFDALTAKSKAANGRAAFEALQKAEDAKKAAAATPPPAAAAEKVANVSKIDDWITKLESLKSKGGEAGLASFPDPEVFKGIGSALRNTAIDVAIGVLKAGKSIGEALDAAMAHIRERSKDFDEPKLRSALGAYLNPPETTGIAHRVSEARGMAPDRGKGVAPAESVEHGRELLQQGLDPQSVLDVFNKTQAVRADDMAVVRAHLERLSKATNDAADQHGVDSPEYKASWEAEKDWRAKVKPMQTEWHRIGQAQQGETDIDTGTFTGLQRRHQENTGTDLKPGDKKRAQRIAKTNKDAQGETGEAQQKFNQHIRDRSTGGIPDAEQRAFDAANKTVREWAIKVAEAENKSRIAKTVQEREVAKIQEARVRKGLEEAQQNARDAAVKMAAAENKARVDAATKERGDAAQLKAAQDALDAANKTVRENAARLAEAENKARSLQAGRDKAAARVQAKAAQKALDAANETVRRAAADLAAKERKLRGDPILRVWTKAKEYLDAGLDNFDDIRHKLATDLGMTVEQVTRLLQQDERAKYLADDLWRKQQKERNLKSQAKAWVQGLSIPGYQKAIASVPRILFGLKVGFHGTVALGTHAPMVAFQPRFWETYVRDFAKMYKMVNPFGGKGKAYYENQVQDLIRRDNYVTANRAGLVNDPAVFEDYNSPDTVKYIFGQAGMGTRGYTILKILRQDMFDQHWDKLPKSAQIPEVAQALADGINHATGVVKGRAPAGTNLALFAPRLEASRVMWLVGDPVKAVNTMLRWNKASTGEKHFAMNQVKEKAWVMGTLTGLLALNAGFLKATGSDQKINLTDPFKPDFLKFKVAGMNVAYGNPMITMARLPLRLFVNIKNEGKLNKIVYEDENVATTLFEYVRSQMSPFAGTLTDLSIGRDYMRKPLPRAAFGILPGKKHLPKRLKAEGVQPYTWPEYASEQLAMIPLQEALKEVWGKGMGMDRASMDRATKALATIIVMGGTGARVSEDVGVKKKTDPAKVASWYETTP